jgi:hypothetical protein
MKQKIKMPANCQGLELDDMEKVVANLILNIAFIDNKYAERESKRDWMNTEYYFYHHDLARLVHTQRLCGSSKLRKAFYIGMLNDKTISIRFYKPMVKVYGTPDFYDDVITDEKAILMHHYLMGRFSYPEGIIAKGEGQIITEHPIPNNKYATIYI